MQFGTTAPDLECQCGDGATVDAGNSRGSANAQAVAQGGNHFNLLFAGKNVHGGSSPSFWEHEPPCGKLNCQALYCAKRSFSSGSSPGVDDPGSALLAQR